MLSGAAAADRDDAEDGEHRDEAADEDAPTVSRASGGRSSVCVRVADVAWDAGGVAVMVISWPPRIPCGG